MRVGPEDRDFGPDIMRRVQSTDSHNMSRHGRGRCLAVHPSNDNPFFKLHHGGQRFGATHHRKAHSDRFIKGRISTSDGR